MRRKKNTLKKLEEALEKRNRWEETKTEPSVPPLIGIETFIEMIKLGLYDRNKNNELTIELKAEHTYPSLSYLKIQYQGKKYQTLIKAF